VVIVLDEAACSILNNKIDGIKDDIRNLNDRLDKFDKRIESLDNKFVSVDRFRPVEMIAYAIISLFGGGLVMAILALVIKK
jgi:hypothetical protein